METKWRVDHGIHRGTITSRDSGSREYDTEKDARDGFQESKTWYANMGYVIWFAYLYAPDGTKTILAPGNSSYHR